MRYHLTLIDEAPEQGSPCIGDYSRQLSLVDASGKTVQSPFVVPSGQKFVITDVGFHAHPNGTTVKTFDGSHAVMMSVTAVFPDQTYLQHVTVPASQVGTHAAAGAQSFVAGPAFVLGTTFCASGHAYGPWNNSSIPIQMVRVHGYLMDDDPEAQ